MSLVTVTWRKSPRRKYGIPRAPGTSSVLTFGKAKEIFDDDKDMFFSGDFEALLKKKSTYEDDIEVEPKVRTRPVKK